MMNTASAVTAAQESRRRKSIEIPS